MISSSNNENSTRRALCCRSSSSYRLPCSESWKKCRTCCAISSFDCSASPSTPRSFSWAMTQGLVKTSLVFATPTTGRYCRSLRNAFKTRDGPTWTRPCACAWRRRAVSTWRWQAHSSSASFSRTASRSRPGRSSWPSWTDTGRRGKWRLRRTEEGCCSCDNATWRLPRIRWICTLSIVFIKCMSAILFENNCIFSLFLTGTSRPSCLNQDAPLEMLSVFSLIAKAFSLHDDRRKVFNFHYNLCHQRLYVIRVFRQLRARERLAQVCESLVFSVLLYACPLFAWLPKETITKLQRRAHCIICFKSCDCEVWRSWSVCHQSRCVKFFEKCENFSNHPLHDLVPARLKRTSPSSSTAHKNISKTPFFFPLDVSLWIPPVTSLYLFLKLDFSLFFSIRSYICEFALCIHACNFRFSFEEIYTYLLTYHLVIQCNSDCRCVHLDCVDLCVPYLSPHFLCLKYIPKVRVLHFGNAFLKISEICFEKSEISEKWRNSGIYKLMNSKFIVSGEPLIMT